MLTRWTTGLVLAGAAATLGATGPSTPAPSDAYSLDLGAGAGRPVDGYVGAGDRAGVWQEIAALTGGVPVPLDGITGAPSSATLTVAVTRTAFTVDNPDTMRDDAALMDDGLNLGGTAGAPETFVFQGLLDGRYRVTSYAWAPDSANFLTEVTVVGADEPPQEIGGAWPGTFVEGITHAVHTVDVEDGTLTIETRVTLGFGTLNGVQLDRIELPPCAADFVAPFGDVDVDDLLFVINSWNCTTPPDACEADIVAPFGVVDSDDLLAVINGWGRCE